MKLKRMLIYQLMTLTVVAVILPFATLVNKDMAYYAYKEATYGFIVRDVIKKEKSPDKQLILINEFLYRKFLSPYRADVIDKDIFNDLMRGIAWCDQRAWALVTFAGKLGIEARLVFTKNPEGVSTHTVSEAKINGRWMLFDPQFGFSGRKNNGFPASYDDLCRHPEFFLLNEKMLMLKKISPERYALTRDFFSSNIYYKDYLVPIFWMGPHNSQDLAHRVISGLVNAYVIAFGRKFAYFYQDAYLVLYSPSQPGSRLYFRTRNYDIYSRDAAAQAGYQKLINDFPSDAETEQALYFLGVLYNEGGNYQSSAATLERLLRDFPQSQWQASASSYLGYNYELLGNKELSDSYYKAASDLYKASSSDSLSSGELKLIERIFMSK